MARGDGLLPAARSVYGWARTCRDEYGLVRYRCSGIGAPCLCRSSQKQTREWLLLIAFLFGFAREVLRIVANITYA